VTDRPPPADIVSGSEPGITFDQTTIPAWVCSACGAVSTAVDGGNHGELAHPARRNPALTCHAAPMWDHERWCIRPKGHDGDHWTPSHGGGRWWPGGAA
jgi:hypothetical protein